MSHAVRLHETGAPDVLKWEEVEVGAPGPGEVRLRQTAVGVNFSETRTRAGGSATHGHEDFPIILGREAAGIIEELGSGVDDFEVGQRVAYGLRRQQGAYTEERLIAADQLVHLPDALDDQTAAALMVKGMTACYLCRRTFLVDERHWVLIHAAAGGVGSLLSQWTKHLGATVIGVVSSDEKAAFAKAHGCDHAIVASGGDFLETVKELTNGEGVHVAYDPIGKPTWESSLKSLRRRGYMVNYGWAGGRVKEIEPLDLMHWGSLYLTKTALHTYASDPAEMRALANEAFDVVLSGAVTVEIGQTYALKDAAQAHADIEVRKTVGSTVLVP